MILIIFIVTLVCNFFLIKLMIILTSSLYVMKNVMYLGYIGGPRC